MYFLLKTALYIEYWMNSSATFYSDSLRIRVAYSMFLTFTVFISYIEKDARFKLKEKYYQKSQKIL
eukprot:TRINITY_DN306_c0_g3_i1.p1 TRINITY_DN306_c0_g3~~TRINITY_DN306_c0_g3_i1.p1  ORF type:complete len:66 (-),score=3.09 TRINITY_DN306_c0_g3_i1:96-293(-)